MTDAPDKATGIWQIGESEWRFCETGETIKSMEFPAGDEYIRDEIVWNEALEAAAKKLENATAPIVPSDASWWRLYERRLCIDAIRAMKREPK